MTVAVWNYMNSSWIGFDDVRVTAVSMKKYYYAGGQRVAMREGAVTGVTGLSFLFGDHLGSTSVTANSSGTKTAEVRYNAWGEARTGVGTTRTSYRFTGQTSEEAGIGLYYYGARFYDPLLGRFASPDSIIPQNQGTLAWDRYSYVNNSPVNYTDPTGHMVDDGCDHEGCTKTNFDLDDPKQKADFDHIVNQYLRTKKNKEVIDNIGTMAFLLDDIAAGTNATYAVVGDLVTLACPSCYPAVLAGYQIFGFVPNFISSAAGGLWAIQGVYTGESDFSITHTSEGTAYSAYISQDTIVALITNAVGWNIHEPNTAAIIDGLVAGYDFGRGPSASLHLPTIPSFMNPNITYSTTTGIGFGWK